MVYQIASEVRGIDAIVFGHTHQQLAELRVGEVLLTQPKNWGFSLSKLSFRMESKQAGGYRVLSKWSTLVPVRRETKADTTVLEMAKPYHELTEAYLNSKIVEAEKDISAAASRIEDTAIIDAIHAVQMHYANADVSFTAAFNPRAAIRKGPVTVRQVAALYVYDNELYAIQGDGKMVRDALENAARFYTTCPDPQCTTGPLINRRVIGYNYDMAQGVAYDIDLTRPAGKRIRNLRFRGEPLKDDQPLRIALNNYRAAGSGGYRMFQGAKLLWRSFDDIRELIIRYYSSHPLPSNPDHNWRVVPANARRVLKEESLAESARPAGTQ
jgi:2',3'-cyclic-nucleotide 2'-phosphodiesterase/3'-nucleotidase